VVSVPDPADPEILRILEAFGGALLAGQYFEAHDILEGAWRKTRSERQQAAIWVAAAFLHWQRGNRHGAAMLLNKAAGRMGDGTLRPMVTRWQAMITVTPCPGFTPRDVAALTAWVARE
jgi:hypothetical protein